MNPTEKEKELQETAQLYRYACIRLKRKVPGAIHAAANDGYCRYLGSVPMLCELLKGLTEAERELIIYDAKSRTARKLADWWERHQEADANREANEEAEKKRLAAIESAREKLNPEERAALGI